MTPRGKLIEHLRAGRGDIAVANLTITPSRQAQVDFSVPELKNVSEIVVAGPASPQRAALEDLAGREVHVRLHSSYHDSLVALNERFAREGRAPVQLRLVRDVYKYYAAYALQLETRAERLAAREKLKEQRTD